MESVGGNFGQNTATLPIAADAGAENGGYTPPSPSRDTEFVGRGESSLGTFQRNDFHRRTSFRGGVLDSSGENIEMQRPTVVDRNSSLRNRE